MIFLVVRVQLILQQCCISSVHAAPQYGCLPNCASPRQIETQKRIINIDTTVFNPLYGQYGDSSYIVGYHYFHMRLSFHLLSFLIVPKLTNGARPTIREILQALKLKKKAIPKGFQQIYEFLNSHFINQFMCFFITYFRILHCNSTISLTRWLETLPRRTDHSLKAPKTISVKGSPRAMRNYHVQRYI